MTTDSVRHERPVRLVKTNEPALLPQNEVAEAAILGSILIDPEAMPVVSRITKVEHFYREAHREVYTAALELAEEGAPVDLITLTDRLERNKQLETIGGTSFVSSLANQVPSSSNVEYYAKIVERCYVARQAIAMSGNLAAAAYEAPEPEALIAIAKAHLDDIAVEVTAAEPRFKLKSIQDLRKRPRPQWIVPGMLQERKLWLLFGDSNTGKSFVALDWSLCMATGTPWNGHEMPCGHVIYVCAEGLDGISVRIDAWLAAHGLDDAPNFHIIDESPNLLENGDVDEVIAEVQSIDEPVIAVTFDTLAMSMPGGDENGPEDMSKAITAIKRVQRECEAAVLTVHHSGKDASKGARGHGSLRAAMDTQIEVLRDHDLNITTLHCYKMRDQAYFKDINFTLSTVSLDEYGDETSCVLVPTDAPTPQPKQKRERVTGADRLFVLMNEMGRPAYHAELKRAFTERYGQSPTTFNNALRELEQAGKIENVGGMWQVREEQA